MIHASVKPLITTPAEVLRDAIQSEVDSRVYLLELAKRAATSSVRTKLLELADREMIHRARIERRYREITGTDAPSPQATVIELPGDLRSVDLPRALKIALDRERGAESNYRFLAERTTDPELATLFVELAEMEWKHKIDIQAEYDASVNDLDRFFEDM